MLLTELRGVAMGRSCEVEMLLRWLGVLLVGTVAATAGGGEGVG